MRGSIEMSKYSFRLIDSLKEFDFEVFVGVWRDLPSRKLDFRFFQGCSSSIGVMYFVGGVVRLERWNFRGIRRWGAKIVT